MSEFELIFDKQQIESVLQKVFLINIPLSAIKWCNINAGNGFSLETTNGKIILINTTNENYMATNKWRKRNNSSITQVLFPLFTIENRSRQIYAVFHDESLKTTIPIEVNNYEHLEILLRSLAENQALNLLSKSETNPKEIETIYKFLTTIVLDDFKQNKAMKSIHSEFDETKIDEAINRLKNEYFELTEKISFVDSIICAAQAVKTSGFINRKSCTFLSLGSDKQVAPLYDALYYIFEYTDEKFRQRHFRKLIDGYFESLEKCHIKYTKESRDKQMQVLVPLVKLELVKNSSGKKKDELVQNLRNFLINPIINPEDVYEIIENHEKSNDYELIGYKLEQFNRTTGHLGLYYYIYIDLKTGNDIKQLKLFVKFIIGLNIQFQALLDLGPAKKEDFVYSKLLPMYIANGFEDLLDFIPKCYLSRTNHILVLNDLNGIGFESLSLNKLLECNVLRLIIKALAKFHACSLLLEETLSRKAGKSIRIDQVIDDGVLDDVAFRFDGPYKDLFVVATDAIYYMTQLIPECPAKEKLADEELNKEIFKVLNLLCYDLNRSKKYRNVITHGDLYLGNILVKSDAKENPVEVKLVDFQLIRYCPPAFELLFLFYSTTSSDTREKYMNGLIDEYYSHITEYINHYGYDSAECFPRKEFDDSVDYLKRFAAIAALLYGQLTKINPKLHKEIMENQEQFNYYMAINRRGLIDLSWKDENYKQEMGSIVAELLCLLAAK